MNFSIPVNLEKKTFLKIFSDVFRIRLRRVCADFMYICDNMNAHYKSLSIAYSDTIITVELRSPTPFKVVEICYMQMEEGCQVAEGAGYKYHDENHVDIAVRDLIGILRNPRISIGTLTINDPTIDNPKRKEFMLKLGREIFKFTHQITVNHLITNGDLSEDEILCIWPFIKPRTLENIDIWWRCGPPKTTDLILESAQWRHAKRLNLRGSVPLEKLTHFRKCTSDGLLDVENLEFIMDVSVSDADSFKSNQAGGDGSRRRSRLVFRLRLHFFTTSTMSMRKRA